MWKKKRIFYTQSKVMFSLPVHITSKCMTCRKFCALLSCQILKSLRNILWLKKNSPNNRRTTEVQLEYNRTIQWLKKNFDLPNSLWPLPKKQEEEAQRSDSRPRTILYSTFKSPRLSTPTYGS
ncbi:hypothetical protein NPIL_113811 [Nephila pilipes]|uniref:Uncharacterized protein n=1 Tax=Nephila pilipes TaxID=299642 RepID=A0A8X6UKU5_NEPPI|nr:hypothetical protein NPIL_113811 [Nephila pilipes]